MKRYDLEDVEVKLPITHEKPYWNLTIQYPANATNGDIIKALFPNAKMWESGECICLLICGQGDAQMFDKDWWNTPYERR